MLNLSLPDVIITDFNQVKYSKWQELAPFINCDAPAVVCNAILDCVDDAKEREVT